MAAIKELGTWVIRKILSRLLVDPIIESIKMSGFFASVLGAFSLLGELPWQVSAIFTLAALDLLLLGFFHVSRNLRADRGLTEIQKQVITETLMAYRGRSVQVHTWNSVEDGNYVGGYFCEALIQAKWSSYLESFREPERDHECGVWLCGDNRGADEDQRSTMDILKDAFDKAKVDFKTDVNEKGFVRIVVGR